MGHFFSKKTLNVVRLLPKIIINHDHRRYLICINFGTILVIHVDFPFVSLAAGTNKAEYQIVEWFFSRHSKLS